jgi:hypothetical protein
MLIELRGDFENLVFGEVFWIALYLPQDIDPQSRVLNYCFQ